MSRNTQLFDRACQTIPGGVNSPVRAFRSVGGAPRFIKRAQGPYMWDADDTRYIDYVGSWGPAILGHAHPEVIRAVQEAAKDGLSFGAPTEAEIEIAEAIAARKAQPVEGGLSPEDRIAELEQANAFLEGRVAELETQVETYERLELMYRDWINGGWEKVVQAKDDTIAELQRTAQARIAMESGEKVRNLNTMRGLAKKLDEAGKGRDIYIDLDEPHNG